MRREYTERGIYPDDTLPSYILCHPGLAVSWLGKAGELPACLRYHVLCSSAVLLCYMASNGTAGCIRTLVWHSFGRIALQVTLLLHCMLYLLDNCQMCPRLLQQYSFMWFVPRITNEGQLMPGLLFHTDI